MKTEIGKILIDIGKMSFAGLVLAGLIRQDISLPILVATGSFTTFITIAVGLYVIWLDKKNK